MFTYWPDKDLTMKFLDLTNPLAPIEKELSLKEIQQVVLDKTGRKLEFENPILAASYSKLFKLVYLSAPIGFIIVANERIEKDTLLCPYGGENIPLSSTENNQEIEYLATLFIDSNMSQAFLQQAQKHGDLGSLFCHLPDEEFLNSNGFKPSDYSKIHQKNVRTVLLEDTNRIYLVATKAIEPGVPLGLNYGPMYWLDMQQSPAFFSANSYKLIDMKQLECSVLAGFYNRTTGKSGLFNFQKHTNDIFGISMLAILALFQGEKDEVYFATTDYLIILNRQEVNAKLHINKKNHNAMIFFPYMQAQGCCVPPGSHIELGQNTIVPVRA